MDLSIVIVNWNSIEYTRQCIDSILVNVSGISYEIIVVDNASRDDCRSLPDTFPSVKLIVSERNLGFAGANNLGVEHSCGDIVLFLNPDTLVRDDAIQVMTVNLKNISGRFGVLGCTLLNRDLSIQMTCIQPFPTVFNQLFGIDWLKRRWPELPLFGIREIFKPSKPGIVEVEVISGACLMVKKEALEAVGRFSTDYFMYAEEADLCYKIRRAGWKIGYLREPQIIHFGGQSTSKREDGFSDLVMRESLFRFFRKFHGVPYALLYRMALLVGAAGRVLMMLPMLVVPMWKEDARRIIRKWGRITAWSLMLQNSRLASR